MINEMFRSKDQKESQSKLLHTVYLTAFAIYGDKPFNIADLKPKLDNDKIRKLYQSTYTNQSPLGYDYNVTSHGDRYKRLFVKLQAAGYATIRVKENKRIECTLTPIDKLSINDIVNISVDLF